MKNEEYVVNDAIQYWRGFEDALEFSKIKTNKVEEQLVYCKEMIEIYRVRLREIQISKKVRKKNARRNRRD